MKIKFTGSIRLRSIAAISWVLCLLCGLSVHANPTGGAVAQGTATFNTAGSQLTINQTSANAFINWQSFNIGAGEITTFVQPSSSSLVWNQINDANPSQILGSLNANGYVVLQNQNGFYIGGQAAISTHGLIMTTAPIPMPDLSSGGAWSFSAPPPAAKIINYGQINIAGGGSVFLIASDIENRSGIDDQGNYGVGTISAPAGKIGLYAGEQVLVSTRPDGRGLSAAVTLPQGSVDNEGKLIADGGSIVAQAQMVNQNGLVQANSAQNVNGVIELVAGDSVTLGTGSQISANGNTTLASTTTEGSVAVNAGNTITVNNGAGIQADGGAISLNADTINQNGRLQANSIQYANGTIALNAGDTVNLGSGSQMIADGDPTITSLATEGAVTANAGNTITVNAGAGIEADGGKISLVSPTVNQNGMLQANSIKNISGIIGINASDAINLGANSSITANGFAMGISPGGSVTLQAGNVFSDQSGSIINVAGGTQGGNAGQVTIAAPGMSLLQSAINAQSSAGYADGSLTIDTANITLNGDGSGVDGQLALNVNSLSSGFAQINLNAAGDIEVSSLWNLAHKIGQLDTVSLLAGNTITVDVGAGIQADGGNITLKANRVNENGLLQANSIQNANGAVEVDAGSSLALGAHAQISASGDPTYANGSPGGFVVLQSGNAYSDTPTSVINVGGQNGGQNGMVEIVGNNLTANSVHSMIGDNFALLINPYDLTLSSSSTGTSYDANNNLDVNFSLNDLAAYSQINLHALDNIELSAQWFLNDPGVIASLSLQAGNNTTLDNGAGINAGKNWNVNLMAGTSFVPTANQPTPASGSDGIYLNDDAYLQTRNGNINVWAANEVLLAADSYAGNDGIRTLNGGNIDVTTRYGNVNTGANSFGFLYAAASGRQGILLPPFYTVSGVLGGVSTVAGGNVTISAGGDVTSYLPSGTTGAADAGTGAFGPEPGNVTITAGGNVYGHYVLANGVGAITAGQNVGAPSGRNSFSLSLITGSWNVNAPNGNIYLQEVRNPRGVFDNNSSLASSVAAHTFDYAPQDSVTLEAGIGVDLTDVNLPRLATIQDQVPVIYPPILNITAGSGGVTLQDNVTLFPSAYQNLDITTTDGGSFVSAPNSPGSTPELLMSDSSQTSWSNAKNSFSDSDHSPGLPVQAADPNPVLINISGDMANLDLITSKATQITLGGDMINCGFSGQNLHASDVTSITVAGQIYNRGPYDFVYGINIPGVPAADLLPGMGSSWDNIFTLALNTATLANLTVPPNTPPSQLVNFILQAASLFHTQRLSNGQLQGANPGFVYDPTTGRLGFAGDLNTFNISAGISDLSVLTQPITILHLVNGLPVIDTNPGDNAPGRTYGQFETDTVSWVDPSKLNNLAQASAGAPSPFVGQIGYRLGGPGEFDINATSIDLGNTYGILSCGVEDVEAGYSRYANLASITPSGATVNVTVTADQTGTVVVDGNTIDPHASLAMLTSTIAAIGGGDVNVTSTGGSMDLGSQELFGNELREVGFGILNSGNGNVNVTVLGDIDINGSRIASYNGGNIFIESLQGNVNVGSGGASYIGVPVTYVDPATGLAELYREAIYGSGIVANTLVDPPQVPGSASVPGNITVETPRGDIKASLGGILQEALNGNISSGPTITLTAGTPFNDDWNSQEPPLYIGNINLGESGAIGGTVDLKATGDIIGLVISRQNSTVNAGQNFSGTVLSGGSANVSGGGTVSGVIVGVTGATVSGAGGVSANVISQNANVGGVAQNTLGATASATSTSQAAAQQSSNDARQQVASNNGGDDDDKKKKKSLPLLHRIKRVTVILPKAT